MTIDQKQSQCNCYKQLQLFHMIEYMLFTAIRSHCHLYGPRISKAILTTAYQSIINLFPSTDGKSGYCNAKY